MVKSKVYFTKEITSENLVKIYEKIGKILTGKVAIKVHSGEKGNKNYLRPEFLKEIIEYVVAHEFCHLKYKTHGKRFFEIIEKHIPEYQKYEREIQNYEF